MKKSFKDLSIEEYKVLTAAVFLLLFWMLTPLILQYKYNISAIKTSFGITTVYFVAFKIWQKFYSSS